MGTVASTRWAFLTRVLMQNEARDRHRIRSVRMRRTVHIVEAEHVDERDSRWEDDSPRFRVYLFREQAQSGDDGVADAWDLTGADVLDAIQWAQQRAGTDDLYAVALVRDDLQSRGDAEPSRGLVWLVGMDWFDDVTGDPVGERTKARMVARRGKNVVTSEPE
jgi:hypothetical protein